MKHELLATECVSEHGKKACKDMGGICHIERDGYYIVNGACLVVGLIILLAYIIPTARKLQGMLHLSLNIHFVTALPALPISVWRIRS
jgi:hypothetical protein